jgi:hypothetical protein
MTKRRADSKLHAGYYHQTFDVRLVLGQSIWRLFGGGDGVLLSVANALVAESLPAAHLYDVDISLYLGIANMYLQEQIPFPTQRRASYR